MKDARKRDNKMNSPVISNKTFSTQSPGRPWHLLLLSAKSDSALDRATFNLIRHFRKNQDISITDAAFTLQAGRHLFSHRRMLVCQDIRDALDALENQDSNRVITITRNLKKPELAFMFPGQGSQYVNMARELYEAETVFRQQTDYCAEHLKPHLGPDLRSLLYPGENTEHAGCDLNQPEIAQPALFVTEYALSRLWMSWGIHPKAMIGNDIGEYVSACLSGVFSLESALKLAAFRGKLEKRPFNDRFDEFRKMLGKTEFNAPQIPWISGITGTWITRQEATDPDYWIRQINQPANPDPGLAILLEDSNRVLLEAGPGTGLTSHVKKHFAHAGDRVLLNSVKDPHEKEPDIFFLLSTLGQLCCSDIRADWAGYYVGQKPRRIPLPTYPFEGRRFWYVHKNQSGNPDDTRAVLSRSVQDGKNEMPPGEPEPAENKASLYYARPELESRYVSPRDNFEESLVNICQELLGIDRIGVHDNVTELGADSMIVMQLSKYVGESFHISISPHHLFSEPTIASLAEKIRNLAPGHVFAGQTREVPGGHRAVPGNLTEHTELLDMVENLSDAELDGLLAELQISR